jgi:hypothetical protein
VFAPTQNKTNQLARSTDERDCDEKPKEAWITEIA